MGVTRLMGASFLPSGFSRAGTSRAMLLVAGVAVVSLRWFFEAPLANALLYVAVAGAATLVLLYSTGRRQDSRRPWRWIGLGIAFWAGGDLVWYAIDAVGVVSYPSVVDGLYLAGYPAFVLGLLVIALANRRKRELAVDLIDAAVVCLSAGLLLWPFVIEPTIRDGWTMSTAVSLGYTVGDLVLLGLLAALWFNPQRRTAAVSLMAGAAALVFIADNLYYIPGYSGRIADSFAETLWLLGYVLIASAALSRRKAKTSAGVVKRSPLLRMILVGFALFSMPGVLVLDGVLGDGLDTDDWAVFVGVFIALVVLIVLRGTLMLGAVIRSRERADVARLRLAAIIDAAGVGIVIQSEPLMTETNKDFQKMLGYTREELAQMNLIELVHPDEVEESNRHISLAGEVRTTFPSRFVRRDGEIVDAQVSLTVVPGNAFRIAVVEDLTERLRLEHELADAQKLEAVGRLAAGVAHDFNNLLTAVSGHAELIRLANGSPASREEEDIEESVEVILDAASRAGDLTHQLLTFSRQHEFTPQQIDTAELIHQTEKLLRRLVGTVTLTTRIDPEAPMILADPSQMDQVILNLAVNALDAMPNGGRLTLAVAPWRMDNRQPARYAVIEDGDYCRITVSDTGIGMNAQTAKRIFEPFFTTKEAGKGTGLGLATSYGIVTSSGGHILVSSEPGQGTEIEIILPAASRAVTPMRPKQRMDTQVTPPARPHKTAA